MVDNRVVVRFGGTLGEIISVHYTMCTGGWPKKYAFKAR